MQIHSFGRGRNDNKVRPLRIAVMGREELANFVEVETPILLVSICDPAREVMPDACGDSSGVCEVNGAGRQEALVSSATGQAGPPLHGISRLVDCLTVRFADVDPAEHQKQVEEGKLKWDDELPEHGAPMSTVVFKAEQARELWRFINKQRADPKHEVLVVQDEGGADRRALSVAYALCDGLRLMRGKTVWRPSLEDWKAGEKDKAPNVHVYMVVKAGRG
jgi:hypothetical protein